MSKSQTVKSPFSNSPCSFEKLLFISSISCSSDLSIKFTGDWRADKFGEASIVGVDRGACKCKDKGDSIIGVVWKEVMGELSAGVCWKDDRGDTVAVGRDDESVDNGDLPPGGNMFTFILKNKTIIRKENSILNLTAHSEV